MNISYKNIALVKEIESPENPNALENRVALIPSDIKKLVDQGINVFVEEGAGLGVGFSDDQYCQNGAKIQRHDQIYRNKDMIIKFKGPAMETIDMMNKGTTLFCMAHFYSYPARAEKLKEQQINVVAMEEILESPKQEPDCDICSRMAMNTFLHPFIENNLMNDVDLYVFQWTPRLRGAVRRASNRYPKTLTVLNNEVNVDDIDMINNRSLFFYDSKTFNSATQLELVDTLREQGAHILDLYAFEKEQGYAQVLEYRKSHKPFQFGIRRIQCLHETGQAGARYGLKLLNEKSNIDNHQVNAVVLGYGNVAQGAIDELYQKGVQQIHVLGQKHTKLGQIEKYLEQADLIINGAEQAKELRGKNFLITNEHVRNIIKPGSVIIDLVGGSETNRSPVEPVINCTFLTDPYFSQNDVIISALWGWPMMGMQRESTIRYSGQIVDVLLGHEKLIEGINNQSTWLEKALVCGPFEVVYTV